jgi:hypothetical protein
MNDTLNEYYQLLEISPSSNNDDITKAFKKLALKYHPDRNTDRIEWANKIMAQINEAYTSIMSARFQDQNNNYQTSNFQQKYQDYTQNAAYQQYTNGILREKLIEAFVDAREDMKDSLYRYFQYNLNNFALRDKISNKSIFNDIVFKLKKCFHTISNLQKKTEDAELIEHFSVFNNMILNFYRASECLNILDSYSNLVDVEAYRMYAEGDVLLHRSHKEIFFDRHNRGYTKQNYALENAIHAKSYFKRTTEIYPDSSWVVEADIKLQYSIALIDYIELFFTEE